MELNGLTLRDGMTVSSFLGVIVYFTYQNNKLQKRITNLEQETTDLAKYVKVLETKIGTTLNQVTSGISSKPKTRESKLKGVSFQDESSDSESDESSEEVIAAPRKPKPKKPKRRSVRNSNRRPISQNDESSEENEHQTKPVRVERQTRPVRSPSRHIHKPSNNNQVNYPEQPRSNNSNQSASINTPIINNAPNQNVTETKVEIIDDDLLSDIEDIANTPSEERLISNRRNISDDNSGTKGNKLKERMSKTKLMAEQMRKKREQKIQNEVNSSTK